MIEGEIDCELDRRKEIEKKGYRLITTDMLAEGEPMTLKEGTLRLRPDGRYEARYMYEGKQNSVYARDKAECVKKLKAAIKDPKTKKPPRTMTVREWLKLWIEKYKKNNVTENYIKTLNHYSNHLGALLDKDINKLTSTELQESVNGITQGRTRQGVHALVKEAFTKAYKLGILKTNLIDVLEIKKHRKTKRDAIPKEELARLVTALEESKYKQPLLFLLMTGLRPSEFKHVLKSDFDFTKRMIHIRGTKTDNAERYVPLPNAFLYLQDTQFVALCPHSMKTLNNALKDLCAQLKLKAYTLYNLRHTYATRLYENGVSDLLIKSWMGHYDISFSKNHYIHLSEEFIQSKAYILDDIFDPKFDPKA